MAQIDGEAQVKQVIEALKYLEGAYELIHGLHFLGDDYVDDKLNICMSYLDQAISDEEVCANCGAAGSTAGVCVDCGAPLDQENV